MHGKSFKYAKKNGRYLNDPDYGCDCAKKKVYNVNAYRASGSVCGKIDEQSNT